MACQGAKSFAAGRACSDAILKPPYLGRRAGGAQAQEGRQGWARSRVSARHPRDSLASGLKVASSVSRTDSGLEPPPWSPAILARCFRRSFGGWDPLPYTDDRTCGGRKLSHDEMAFESFVTETEGLNMRSGENERAGGSSPGPSPRCCTDP